MLQLNPSFESGGSVQDLISNGALHASCDQIFRFGKTERDTTGVPARLHAHQRDAIELARKGRSYVLTSGTGSGKSLTYIIPIVDHVLRRGSGKGIQAVVVYPMNALANSQEKELEKFLGRNTESETPPVTFAKYTGQEDAETREAIKSSPPDILLTNYMMLELLLTRTGDEEIVRAAQGLRFLVLDEMHTYRGRQGSDVALLVRRCRQAFAGTRMICVGTSATMASGGTTDQQRQAVAEVAQSLFGEPVGSEQVVNELLVRITDELDFGQPAVRATLAASIRSGDEAPTDYEAFRTHPLSSWIESTFGIRSELATGRLMRQVPRPISGESGAAHELALLTGCDAEACVSQLHRFLNRGCTLRKSPTDPYPLFAFRLHQFLTRGDTVWTSLETESQRHLALRKAVTKPGEPEKPLYPLVFCRHCGAEYHRVFVAKQNGVTWLKPRDDQHRDLEQDGHPGYLYLPKDAPWPAPDSPDLLDRLPEAYLETAANGSLRIRRDNMGDVPEAVNVGPDGRLGDPAGLAGALIRESFHFCLNPECRVTYAKTQRSERTKLNTLGVDNRSTATTILAVRALMELQQSDLSREARKLLSFTDNRQDASLQAGHFNDFTQVVLLRSALYRTLLQSGENGVPFHELPSKVFTALHLPFEDYAADPDLRGPNRDGTHNALRQVIEYFICRDLKRNWRVTAPNLEDCGLLTFSYKGLDEADGLLRDDEIWSSGITSGAARGNALTVPLPSELAGCPRDTLREVLITLLDLIRHQLAVKVNALDGAKQQELINQTTPQLREGTVWYLEESRSLERAVFAWPRPKSQKTLGKSKFGSPFDLYVSAHGGFGRYLKRVLESLPQARPLKRDQLDPIIQYLFTALRAYGILEQGRGDESDRGYQINVSALIWRVDSGTRPTDKTRLLADGDTPAQTNTYFVERYKTFADTACRFEAREHTAQVSSADRVEREKAFRTGDLPLLFCSPTMELGVDIAQLNLVNLRNVPPTPANYAQRSGRAGRSGQTALVYTYCAGRSPHDQYYYRRPEHMVAGIVAAPRLELRNQDLVRSHVHAIWMEVAQPNLGPTLSMVLDLTPDGGRLPLPLREEVLSKLRDVSLREKARKRSQIFLDEFGIDLRETRWYHDRWLQEVLEHIERSFDKACLRWRELYRAAVLQRKIHHDIILDNSRSSHDREMSKRLRAQAESQITLLTEPGSIQDSDFYTYRYLAAEGFLPGYNFPRLPLSAFVPARRRNRGRDEYLSRPRFLAISEFGPRNLVYHEGAQYRVSKVNLDFGSDEVDGTHQLTTDEMKRCPACGYAHMKSTCGPKERCDQCDSPLTEAAEIVSLVRMQNVSLKLAQRITCDEEERQRFGYRLVTAYRFPEVNGQVERLDAHAELDGAPLLRLSYGDTTTLYRINMGWLHQKQTEGRGFLLDVEKGFWASNQQDDRDEEDAAQEGRKLRVVPFVMDTKNALILRLETPPDRPTLLSLRAALKEGIQRVYQLEPRELACEALPMELEPRELLFYEATEGGAGVLRQLAEDPTALAKVARAALETCHYDPNTLEDKGATSCGLACYECLLDYANQPDHDKLDRTLVRDLLSHLMRAQCRPAGGTGTRAERVAALKAQCDSKLEKDWLDMLDSLGLRLPSHAQYSVPDLYTRPDFYYQEEQTAIYVDGPPHDDLGQVREDGDITRRMQDVGYAVIRFHHKANWKEIFQHHPDIFGRIS